MKTLNSKIEIKEEDSKIKKTFKKLKNAFVVGTAALMITCGGTDTTTDDKDVSKYNKLPEQILQFAEENNLKKTYDVSTQKHPIYQGFIDTYIHFCSKEYSKNFETTTVTGVYSDMIDIKNTNIPFEVIMRTSEMQKFNDEYVSSLHSMIKFDNNRAVLDMIGAARPPPGFKLFLRNDLDSNYSVFRDFYPVTSRIFEYIIDKSKDNLELIKPPAFILCYAKYSDTPKDDSHGIGRFIFIDYNEFMTELKTRMDEDEIFRLIEINVEE